MSSVYIVPFVPTYQDQVITLISCIQQEEVAIPISAKDQPDLYNIPEFYQKGAGNFWVALDEEQVVGTVGLLDLQNQQGALRKMFVAQGYRGKEKATAAKLLATLCEQCIRSDIREIYLGTTAQFVAAHRFYEKQGFVEIRQEQLPPSFPVMKVDSKFYYRMLQPDVLVHSPLLTLALIPEQLAICRLPASAEIPNWALFGTFFCITRTTEEVSLVCPEHHVPPDALVQKTFRALRVVGTLDFGLVGILATLTKSLAQKHISVFVVSTYDTDYLLVREHQLVSAMSALREAGHSLQE